MPRPIQDLLDDILNARYGEEVRTSIHDSIEQCYSDVSASETTAATAAANANDAASSANTAASIATAAASDANTAAGKVNKAVSDAEAATNEATTAAGRATAAANTMETARINAVAATNDATAAASSARQATTDANNATTNATNAAGQATNAASNANSEASSCRTATENANAAADDCNTAQYNATVAANAATNASTRANAAAASIENLSVTSENVGPDTRASASISTVDGHKNIHFILRQGATGAPYIIKGRAYSTLDELIGSVTSPAIGDQYNVGTEAPYNIYRWTGTNWEDQGRIGVSILNLTDEEIDTIWAGTQVVSETSKYVNHQGLYYLLRSILKVALDNKVTIESGKGLSTNDFTDNDVAMLETHGNQISALQSQKVDKITGKGLSTNDFTTEYLNLIVRNASLIGEDDLETTAQNLIDAVNEVNALAGSKLDDSYKPIRIQQATFSSLPITISNVNIKSNMDLISCRFGTPGNVVSDISWSTADGSLTLNGTLNGPTTADIVLMRVN